MEAAAVDSAPALLTRGAGEAEITSICRLDGGKRLVAVLSPERLFRSDLVKRIMADHAPSIAAAAEEKHEMASVEEQFVVFRLGAQDYGMAITAVAEIARCPAITRLPKAPAFVDGIINLRGSVVPVVDLRRRFGFRRKRGPATVSGFSWYRFPADRPVSSSTTCRRSLRLHRATFMTRPNCRRNKCD